MVSYWLDIYYINVFLFSLVCQKWAWIMVMKLIDLWPNQRTHEILHDLDDFLNPRMTKTQSNFHTWGLHILLRNIISSLHLLIVVISMSSHGIYALHNTIFLTILMFNQCFIIGVSYSLKVQYKVPSCLNRVVYTSS